MFVFSFVGWVSIKFGILLDLSILRGCEWNRPVTSFSSVSFHLIPLPKYQTLDHLSKQHKHPHLYIYILRKPHTPYIYWPYFVSLAKPKKQKHTLIFVIDSCRIDAPIQFIPSSHFNPPRSHYTSVFNANTMPHQRSTITTKKPEECEHDESETKPWRGIH